MLRSRRIASCMPSFYYFMSITVCCSIHTNMANTKLRQRFDSCLHTKAIDDVGNANNTIIRASDTDIAVIMLHHAWKFSATLWMDTGTSNGKNRRWVSVRRCAWPCRPTMRSRGQIPRQRSFVLFQFFFDRDCPSTTIKWSSVYEFMTETCRVRTKIVWIESYDQGLVGLFSCGLAWYKLENWIMHQQLISCFDSTQGSIFHTNFLFDELCLMLATVGLPYL